jgi:hypothetical protein
MARLALRCLVRRIEDKLTAMVQLKVEAAPSDAKFRVWNPEGS